MGKETSMFHNGFQQIPDDILLYIFSFLKPGDLAQASKTCQRWFQVSLDDLLWKELFYRQWGIDKNVPMMPGKMSWREEFKRLHYFTPAVESEVIKKHKDQVLHVSFSHRGDMFATCSKDGTVKVWWADYPATLRFHHDMKDFTWKYTQFSNFNETDSLLLVSGVHFGNMSTSGEIAVFSLKDDFELQCRVINKPYDVFGTWYDDSHLLSGNLHWTGHLNSCSALWLNKASQATESERESVVMRLFRFNNVNASSIRTIMIANIYSETTEDVNILQAGKSIPTVVSPSVEVKGSLKNSSSSRQDIGDKLNGTIRYKTDYHKAEEERKTVVESSVDPEDELPCACCSDEEVDVAGNSPDNCLPVSNELSQSKKMNTAKKMTAGLSDKLLIFTMGSLTYTPHQIGIKRIKVQNIQSDFQGTNQEGNRVRILLPDVDMNNYGVDRPYDNVDETFDMDGHIIGMSLSPDQRYLYVNSRPWPQGFSIEDPLMPPPIAQEIDVHVIDLHKMKEVGTMLRSHKAYTPNDECFFIFLDVCDEYVASGAEDKHGYIWDRHYGTCLHRFPHSDVVNCVAFNPVDPEVLVTVSDDNSIKIWRSKHKELLLKSKQTE